MAIDRTTAADVGGNVVAVYSYLEARLIREVARRVALANADPSSVDWAERHLRQTVALRTTAEGLVRNLAVSSRSAAAASVIESMTLGRRAALVEVGKHANTPGLKTLLANAATALNAGRDLPGAGSIMRLADSLAGRLGELGLPVVRWAVDAYRGVIAAGAAPSVLAGLDTRRKASETAWNQILDRGVTGFTDKAGRNWRLSTYVEMATRTTVTQAAIEGHNAQLGGLGLDLVIVSDVAGECELCRPWEGRVLTRTGPAGAQTVRVQRLDSDDLVTVEVAGSVAEAISAGLFHPQCRHTLGAYFPGLTKTPPRSQTEDPAGDRARRDLRGLERDKRKWLQREAGALDAASREAARARVRELDGKIETLIATRGGVDRGLPRRRDREQIDLGNVRPGAPPRKRVPPPAPTPKPTPKPAPTPPAPPAPKPPAKTAPPAPVKATPPPAKAAPAPAAGKSKAGPPNPKSPAPALPRLTDPYETFNPPPNSKYFDPNKHPIVPRLPAKNPKTGVYTTSPAPVVDYGGTAYVPPLRDLVAGRAHLDNLMGRVDTRDGRLLIPQGMAEAEVQAALELFGDLAPRALMLLNDVHARSVPYWQTHGANSNAFYMVYDHSQVAPGPSRWRQMFINPNWYNPSNRNNLVDLKTYAYQSGWNVQGGYPASGGTIIHELGHHLQTMMYGNRAGLGPITAYTQLDQRIVDVIIGELGLTWGTTAPSYSAVGLTNLVTSSRNQTRVGELVSQYGSKSFEEMFAEIFAEYATLGVKARPHIRRIGEAIVRFAETGQL